MNKNEIRDPRGSDELDAIIRSALTARAGQVVEASLSEATIPGPRDAASGTILHPALRWPWARPLLAAAAIAAVAVATSLIANGTTAHHARPASSGGVLLPHASTPAMGTSVPAPQSSTHATPNPVPPGGASRSSAQPSRAAFDLGYEPLWPFADNSQVGAWESAYQRNGSQPWHRDAAETALLFTRNYLGFTELTLVTSATTDGAGAHIGVGYVDPGGTKRTSAVLHLVRFGSTAQAPWEVVGSDDTTLSLEQPAYGSSVTSPVAIGGHITGVDEAVKVSVRSLARGAGVAPTLATVPAGGNHSPWSTTPVDLQLHGVLTVVAATGGHLQRVERFAIQGITAS